MASLVEKLAQIETLRRQIGAFGILPADVLRRIEYRFRLECNYFSNRQEGGTLTRQETRSVMIGNISVNEKPLKDIREMKGHDEAMTEIMRIGRGEATISEKRILEIHKTILVEDDPELKKQVGKWKTIDNEIILSTGLGDKFNFPPHDEVPAAMHKLLNWLNAELEKGSCGDRKAIHPAVLAFEFHHRFLTIHPFFDGNGRTARLLSNLILVAAELPPFFIKDDEKEIYNRYLGEIQAFGASPDLFLEFMCGLLIRSLQLTLDVIEGRDVEQEDDWEKKLSLLVTNLSKEEVLKISRSSEVTSKISREVFLPILEKLISKLEGQFDLLFLKKEMHFGVNNSVVSIKTFSQIETILEQRPAIENVYLKYLFAGFKRQSVEPFAITTGVGCYYHEYNYSIQLVGHGSNPLFTRYYHEILTAKEGEQIISICGNHLFQQIEQELKKA